MFSSSKNSSQRCNGNLAVTSKPMGQLIVNKKNIKNSIDVRNFKNSLFQRHFKPHGDNYSEDYEENIQAHSIIDLGQEKPRIKLEKFDSTDEIVERINVHDKKFELEPNGEDVNNFYQQIWFSAGLERGNFEQKSREERIEITRHELKRHLHQILRSNLGQVNKMPEISNFDSSNSNNVKSVNNFKVPQPGYDRLVAPKVCNIDDCHRAALPCTKHCTLHIMCNPEQVLFNYCTAKFADNTQCAVPVFDISHELPLCPEHARKRDNYKLYQEAKPKKLRKKVKPSAMIRPQKRNKKKRRPPSLQNSTIVVDSEVKTHLNSNSNSNSVSPSAINVIESTPILKDAIVQETIESESPELVEDMHIVDQVLALNEHDLTAQASHILEETDINTVLSTIHVDEFSDFFSVNRNGEFEQPSREEAEELEKALAEVDNDVKSLEKLSQTHGLLDSFLDEHTLTEQLVQLPDVFHNGYSVNCGDSMVTQTPSFLLPVEPHSNS